jgi:hypothetical protein
MTVETLKQKLAHTPETIDFSETIATIDAKYNFTPTAFKNGDLKNDKGQNSGSCKLFAFAVAEQLTKEETLACFGQYYFKDVLLDPDGDGHQNIRNFMRYGFSGLNFETEALSLK